MVKKINVKREIVQLGIVKLTFDLFDEGGCQCFKDCDCYKNRGIIKHGMITFDKLPILEEAIALKEQQAKSKEAHVIKLAKIKDWKVEIGQKEFYRIVSSFKQTNKSLKRFTHKEIWENDNYTSAIYHYYMKNN